MKALETWITTNNEQHKKHTHVLVCGETFLGGGHMRQHEPPEAAKSETMKVFCDEVTFPKNPNHTKSTCECFP